MTTTSDEKLGTILLIDDEEGIRKLVARLVDRLKYKVISAESGQLGIEAFDALESEPHAVLLDHNMPEMDGVETFRRLQEAGCEAPIFIMSGYDKKSLKLDLPVAGYVSKPINIAQLKQQLAECRTAP